MNILFDIDGTLADCNHRLEHVTNGKSDWKKFFDEMDKDMPIPAIITLYHNLRANVENYIVICTGRPITHSEITINWLAERGITFDLICFRSQGDYRPDMIVKQEMLEKLSQEHGWAPDLAIDDSERCVALYKELSITTLQIIR